MLATFVLRLDPARLAIGEVVGHAEAIESGETVVCHGLSELLAFLTRTDRNGAGAAR